MNLVEADSLSFVELAELFTAGYGGYFTPIRVDEETMRSMVESWDIDLSRSRAVPGVGVCNLGVRGGTGWIGGLGVVPAERRHGVGRALMEAVLAEAPPLVMLEVIEQNEPAIRLYEDLGFERTRILEVWTIDAVDEAEARRVDPSPLGQTGLPWQRADESLPGEYERLEVDGGSMLIRGANVLQLDARDEHAAAQLLSRGTKLHYVNVPEGDVASRAASSLGGTLSLRQYEMALRR